MKKLNFILCACYLATVISFSTAQVDNQNEELSIKDKKALVELNNEIKQIGQDYVSQNTRMAKWLKWVIFCCADAAGYLIGGTEYSAALSKMVWDMAKEEAKEDKEVDQKKSKEEAVAKMDDFKESNEMAYQDLSPVAVVHNEICRRVTVRQEGDQQPMEVQELADAVEEASVYVCPKTARVEIDGSKLEQVANVFDAKAPLETAVNSYKPFIPQEKLEAWEITGTVIKSLQYVEDNDCNYSKKVMGAVENAKIPAETKTLIKNSVSIAIASSNLWNSEKLKEIITK